MQGFLHTTYMYMYILIEADIHEYVRMSYVDKSILGPLVHMWYNSAYGATF